MNPESRNKFKTVMCYNAGWYLIAHGYRCLNLMLTHDSMGVVRSDIAYQRSIGRFLQPYFALIFGSIATPWMIGILAALFGGIAAFLVSELFDLDGKINLLLLTGIMACNMVVTDANLAFVPWVHYFSLALLLSVCGIWLFEKNRLKYYVLGAVALFISMGLYQAYISVSLALLIILAVRSLYRDNSVKDTVIKYLKQAAGILGAALVYFCVYRLSLILHQVKEAQSYNSLQGIEDYHESSLFDSLAVTYRNFFSFLNNQGVYASTIIKGAPASELLLLVIRIFNIAALIFIPAGIIVLNIIKKKKIMNVLLSVLLIVLFPLAANFVCFMSKGMEHDLMIYGVLFTYIFAMVVFCDLRESNFLKTSKYTPLIVAVPLGIIIWNSVIFSNQAYYKLHLQEQALLSTMTRIMYQVENTDGYVPGETPVVLVGSFEDSDYPADDYYLSQVSVMGMGKTPITGNGVFYDYIHYFLQVKVNLTQPDADLLEKASDMPSFPTSGYVRMVDGRLLVKISD